jgi:hypothetical protein
MNPQGTPRPRAAFTRTDLILLLGVVTLLAAVAWPALANTQLRSQRVGCLSNLRRVGQAFHMWADSHGGMFPWATPASRCFLALSNELGTPWMLACPADNRAVANVFDHGAYFGDANVSYFAGFHAQAEQGRTWLSGDRNLRGSEGIYCSATRIDGCTAVDPASSPQWDLSIHALSGNLLRVDGSAHQVSNAELTRYAAEAAAQDPAGRNDILKPKSF